MNDRRISKRRRVLKAGKVVFDTTSVDCVVRDLSDSGAGVQVDSPFGIPHEFSLTILADHSNRACRVVWRKQKRLGIAFY